MQEQNEDLYRKDREFVWHPLTQHKTHPGMLGIERASAEWLYDLEGKRYVDGISSWYTAVYGHCNPAITSRVAAQMKELDQVVFSGFTHKPAVQLAERLIRLLPQGQSKIFYSDNGSTATEIGIKMALQYHFNRGEKRPVLLALEGGFHGDTFGSMSVSGLSVYNGPFEDFFLQVERISLPGNDEEPDLDELRNRLERGDVAGFIYEPLVQGAAGMKMHSAESLSSVLTLMKEFGVVTIADEVMTGFGKTETYFASEQLEEKPDIICMSKALTAGLLPMAATSCTEAIYQAFYSDDLAKGLFHGHTYTANPLACTAALAALDLLESEAIMEARNGVMKAHSEFLEELKSMKGVRDPRQRGVILAFELDTEMERYGNLRDKLYKEFMDQGVFLRPLGNTIYTLPPYITGKESMQKIYNAMKACVR